MAGIAPALGDRALHDDVAVQDAAHGVGDRLVMVVAVHQHGEEAGDRSAVPSASDRARRAPAARQLGEDGGRCSPWWSAVRRRRGRSRAGPWRSGSR